MAGRIPRERVSVGKVWSRNLLSLPSQIISPFTGIVMREWWVERARTHPHDPSLRIRSVRPLHSLRPGAVIPRAGKKVSGMLDLP